MLAPVLCYLFSWNLFVRIDNDLTLYIFLLKNLNCANPSHRNFSQLLQHWGTQTQDTQWTKTVWPRSCEQMLGMYFEEWAAKKMAQISKKKNLRQKNVALLNCFRSSKKSPKMGSINHIITQKIPKEQFIDRLYGNDGNECAPKNLVNHIHRIF